MSEEFRMNRSAFKITEQGIPDQDWQYWLAQPLEARWRALEFLRQHLFGYNDDPTPRLQRVYRVVKRA